MASKQDGAISAFEKRRLENIKTNNAILKDISTTAQRILPPTKPAAPKKSRKPNDEASVRQRPQRAPRRVQPTRQSSRLAGLDADSEVLKRKAAVDAEAEAEDARAKRLRVNSDLNLSEIVVEGRKWNGALDGLSSLKGLSFNGAQPGVRTFTKEDVDETDNAGLKQLRGRMGALTLYEKFAVNDIKLTPQRVYSLGFHPTEDKPLIFAGDKEGAMGVFDASQEPLKMEADEEEESSAIPVVSAFKTHARTITGLLFSTVDANAVYSSSYDSSIRKLDIEKGTSIQVYAPADPTDDLPVSAIDMATSDVNIILFSTLQGDLGRHDLRTPSSEAEIWNLTDQKIGGFSIHPLQPHLVATASLDRTLKIWDLRKIVGSGSSRHPSLLGEHESRLSVSHASWSRQGYIATSSYDDTVKIYDFSTAAGGWKPGQNLDSEAMAPAHVVRHNNQTGRWVTILKPQWQLRPADGIDKFVIGNMNRFVDVFAADGEQLAQLEGDGITAVPAVAHFHPTLDWVAGANASGKLALWM